jgi:EmrB/QacA subfamily drug resistance transporter
MTAGQSGSEEGLVASSAQGRWVIAATVLGSGIATLDATVVGIALPSIGRDFHTEVSTLQWVVIGYSLTLAAFLLLGGSLGDRLGRRRVFQFGVVWFAAASVACGLAPDAPILVAARIVQGVGAALLTPASLAILQASFRPGERATAIGAWSGLGGVATAGGPLIGGYLISAASWRWVFFINVPVAVTALAVAARHVPESRGPSAAGGLDLSGAGLAVVGLAAVVYGLIEGPNQGWGAPAVGAAALTGVIALAALMALERRRTAPMLPLELFSSRQFSAANAVTFVVYAGLGGALFLLPVALQISAGYSPLGSGLALLPVTVIMLVLSARSGRVAARIGPRLQMSVGPVIVGAGFVVLARAAHPGAYVVQVLPAAVILGTGLAVTVAPLTTTALGAAPTEQAGSASAVNNVVARLAGLIAVAVLPVAAGLTGPNALHPATLATGFRVAVDIAGGACVAGGLLAAALIRNPSSAGADPRRQDWAGSVDGASLHPDQRAPGSTQNPAE